MLKLSLKLAGKALRGGLLPFKSLWQIEQSGELGVAYCVRWHSMQSLCPGKIGCAELSVR